jgi:hypothetical protein
MQARTTGTLLLAALLAGGASGCNTNKAVTIPPPGYECPTGADQDRLAELLPNPLDDAALAIEVDNLGEKFIRAAAYCEMAERRLR